MIRGGTYAETRGLLGVLSSNVEWRRKIIYNGGRQPES